jgi:hypothetical protein
MRDSRPIIHQAGGASCAAERLGSALPARPCAGASRADCGAIAAILLNRRKVRDREGAIGPSRTGVSTRDVSAPRFVAVAVMFVFAATPILADETTFDWFKPLSSLTGEYSTE